jgi:hypothetical protein
MCRYTAPTAVICKAPDVDRQSTIEWTERENVSDAEILASECAGEAALCRRTAGHRPAGPEVIAPSSTLDQYDGSE